VRSPVFYETAGVVKVFVFASVFSPSGVFAFAFVFAFSREWHSSRASIRTVEEPAWEFGAWWCPMTTKGRCYLKNGL
jgi:hypothetical protein